jgi:hypothetical protein
MELDYLDKNKFCFITYRAHISEPQVFEDFINTLIPYISLKFPNYIYSIEKDDTCDRHIHLLLQHDEKDKQKLKQKIEAKYFKDFKKSIQDKQTDLTCAIKYGKGPDGEDFGFTMMIEDKMKCIGYIFKDITRRNKNGGLSQSLITQCCDFYFSNRRIKNTTDNDWKQLTTKNIHIKIEEYCKTTGQDVMSPLLQFNMVKDKHTFIQLSNKQRKMAIAELAISQGKDNQKIRTEMEGEEYVQSEYYTPDEIMSKYKNLLEETKRLRDENEKLKDKLKRGSVDR